MRILAGQTPQPMKGILKILAWASTGIAVLLMLLGIIGKLAGGTLLNHWWSNYYWPAHNFLLLGIVLLLFAMLDREKKE